MVDTKTYHVIGLPGDAPSLEDELNRLAGDGFELVGLVSHRHIFMGVFREVAVFEPRYRINSSLELPLVGNDG